MGVDEFKAQQLADDFECAIDMERVLVEAIPEIRIRPSAPKSKPKPSETEGSGGPQPASEEAADWIAFRLVDQRGRPVADRRYEMLRPDGEVDSGVTGGSGWVRLKPIPSGTCELTFPEIEEEAFRPYSLVKGTSSNESGGPVCSTAGGTIHTVCPREHLGHIARFYGFEQATTVWNHSSNSPLRQRRADPYLLLPGDEVVIPEKTPATFRLATGKEHPLTVYLQLLTLRVKLLTLSGEPLQNASVRVSVDGQEEEQTTNGEGFLDLSVPMDAHRASLQALGLTYELALGGLDPAAEPSGIRQRLCNLGFCAGDEEPSKLVPDPLFELGLELLQVAQELPIDGAVSPPLIAALAKEHGC